VVQVSGATPTQRERGGGGEEAAAATRHRQQNKKTFRLCAAVLTCAAQLCSSHGDVKEKESRKGLFWRF